MRMKQGWGYCLSLTILLLCIFQVASVSVAGELNRYGVKSNNPYVVRRFVHDGKEIDEVIVPGRPPEFYRAPETIIPDVNSAAGIIALSNVPAFDWSYGCSATSAAMMFGYYDNTGYPNLYAGPANGGVCPMTNAAWGPGECPLSATHLGIDGRLIKGHVDDYWIAYGSTAQDPFIGNWTQHVQGECTGDFMGTNQSSKSNSDGSTTFWNYTDGTPLYDYAGAEPGRRDGCHGMKLFFESRGYTVTSNYSQYIYGYNGNTKGFTFTQYKQEIDAGRPVLIQVNGHTMLGYGYDDLGSVVYLRDTWDYNSHSMIWGGSYSGMQHYGVAVFQPSPAPSNLILSVSPTNRNVAKEAGTTTFEVSNTGTGTMPWTAEVTSGSSWLSITSGSSGTDAGTITCEFLANETITARTGTIRVTAAGATGSPMDVTVVQAETPAQPVISVSPDSREVAKEAGTTTFEVSNTGTGTMPWTAEVTSGNSWLSITSGSSGTDAGTITCEFLANETITARTGTIRV
ncbi:MAG: BACON domain-containing carbohydrate-binding protein, partial [Desulfosalsimonadaceae bacterium]|nr:BACON domain-containing carbohydrate-binding protein [Desulfosalsimonadaceae bacterium]